jgi:uncharacterized protein YggU (UPF0235/DUF167 family)
VTVRLTPKSSRDEVTGTADVPGGIALAARVRAAPEKGSANAALERLLAEWLGVPRTSVSVEAGGKSRVKSVRIAGDVRALEIRIEQLAAELPSR